MERRRVLFLAHRLPYPPDKGDKIRTFHELAALRSFARVTVACFIDNPRDAKYIEPLSELCDAVIAVPLDKTAARTRSLLALPRREPMSLAYYRSSQLAGRVRELGPFDTVLAFSSTMAPYAEMVEARRRVLDLCDLDSEKWAQYASRRRGPFSWIHRVEAGRLARYESEVAARFDATLLISESEAELLRARSAGADVRVVPNGIDLERNDPSGIDVTAEPHTAVFCGVMDYFSNVDAVVHFCRRILPRVRAAIPDAEFRIVGSNPTARVRELGAIPGVTVTGWVPDVRPEILRCAVSVAPLRLGRGVPNKILEALALELPVVTTPNGAAGLALDRFEGADVANDDASFADAVIRRFREANGSGARRYPEHRLLLAELYDWTRNAVLLRAAVEGN